MKANYMPSKVWDEITYPFLNFNGCTLGICFSFLAAHDKVIVHSKPADFTSSFYGYFGMNKPLNLTATAAAISMTCAKLRVLQGMIPTGR